MVEGIRGRVAGFPAAPSFRRRLLAPSVVLRHLGPCAPVRTQTAASPIAGGTLG